MWGPKGPFGILRGHLARANPQWRDIVADAEYYQPTSLGAEAAVKERWERIRRMIRGR